MPTISNLSDAALNEIIDSIVDARLRTCWARPPDLLRGCVGLAAAAEDAESAAKAGDDGAASAAGDGAMAVDEAVGRHFAAAIKPRIVVLQIHLRFVQARQVAARRVHGRKRNVELTRARICPIARMRWSS